MPAHTKGEKAKNKKAKSKINKLGKSLKKKKRK